MLLSNQDSEVIVDRYHRSSASVRVLYSLWCEIDTANCIRCDSASINYLSIKWTAMLFYVYQAMSILLWPVLLLPFINYDHIPVKFAIRIVWVASFVEEHSLLLLARKLISIYSFYTRIHLIDWFYYSEVACCLFLWSFHLKSYYSFWIIDEKTRAYKSKTSTNPPTIFSFSFWVRIMNPYWYPRHISSTRNIVYATDEEIASAGPGSSKLMSLDIHKHICAAEKCPVLIYIHDGLWYSGDKSKSLPPFLYYLALKKWIIVCINHRLPPFAYPAQLTDVKRAIRWTRMNISKHGGDPAFISVSGSNSGAHLAVMASLTQNDPFYQTGFEDQDTTIQACISINGCYSLFEEKKSNRFSFSKWFTETVMNEEFKRTRHEAFLKASSPNYILTQMNMDKTRLEVASVGNISVEKQEISQYNIELPPVMIFHGDADSIFPAKNARQFAQSYRKIKKIEAEVSYIEFSNANNLYDRVSGPRGHYLAYGVERFLTHWHTKYTSIEKNETV